jgi:dihydrofolate reductase
MIRVACFGVSLDGYSAGPDQDLEHPLGHDGQDIMGWFFPTRTFRKSVLGQEGGEDGVDNKMAEYGMEDLGAWILGRNMFGPVRGPWPDDQWKGWWGDEPPYHCPVFVLTHHARAPIEMKGGTTFHFVTDGIQAALASAKKAAGDKDVRIGGGVATVRQYLMAGLVDEIHLAQRPVLLGRGEHLWAGMDLRSLGYASKETIAGERAAHHILHRR